MPATDAHRAGSFDVDAFVTPLVDLLPTSQEPGVEPDRYPNADPDPSNWPVFGFAKDWLLVVLHGPVVVNSVEWYLLTTAYLGIDTPTAWSPATAPDGTRLLAARPHACPISPMTADELWGQYGLTDGVPACYGHAEITIAGDLTCSREADPYVHGPTWLGDEVCRLDPTPAIYGLDVDPPAGRYEVTGHFDDPQSSTCRDPQSDDPRNRITAVLACRRMFVATTVERLGR